MEEKGKVTDIKDAGTVKELIEMIEEALIGDLSAIKESLKDANKDAEDVDKKLRAYDEIIGILYKEHRYDDAEMQNAKRRIREAREHVTSFIEAGKGALKSLKTVEAKYNKKFAIVSDAEEEEE
jgi:chromosome segregation ATPase